MRVRFECSFECAVKFPNPLINYINYIEVNSDWILMNVGMSRKRTFQKLNWEKLRKRNWTIYLIQVLFVQANVSPQNSFLLSEINEHWIDITSTIFGAKIRTCPLHIYSTEVIPYTSMQTYYLIRTEVMLTSALPSHLPAVPAYCLVLLGLFLVQQAKDRKLHLFLSLDHLSHASL